MLPRELVEELISRSGSAGLHVIVALPDAFDGLLIVLALPFEVVESARTSSRASAVLLPRRRARSSSCASRSGFTDTVSMAFNSIP